MITGAHAIVFSKRPELDREFLRDVLALPNVDVGGGWLIFGLPPSEVAVHPSENNGSHELSFICEDVQAFIAQMEQREVECSAVEDQGWGLLTHVSLPGGGKLGVYQARHARPEPMSGGRPAKSGAKARARKQQSRRRPNKALPVPKAAKKPARKAAKKAAKKAPRRVAKKSRRR
jgi:hypothetical protein